MMGLSFEQSKEPDQAFVMASVTSPANRVPVTRLRALTPQQYFVLASRATAAPGTQWRCAQGRSAGEGCFGVLVLAAGELLVRKCLQQSARQ